MNKTDIREEAQLLGYDCGFSHAPTTDIALHSAIAELVRSLHTGTRPHADTSVAHFATLASTYIPGVAEASVMLLSHKHILRSAAGTGTESQLIDKLQEDLREGPAIDALERPLLRVGDLSAETRWPQFARAALAATPVRSMVCFRLFTHIESWGVLTLHANSPHALDDGAEQLGSILATHAALSLETMQRSRQYRSALGSRDIIGQAKGMLMERFSISSAAAFSLLTRLSQESGKPVVVIAKEMVETKPAVRAT